MKLFEVLDLIKVNERVEIKMSKKYIFFSKEENNIKEYLEEIEHREIIKINSIVDLKYGSRLVIEIEEE